MRTPTQRDLRLRNQHEGYRDARRELVSAFMIVVYMIWPKVMKVTFRTFACDKLYNTNATYLRSNYLKVSYDGDYPCAIILYITILPPYITTLLLHYHLYTYVHLCTPVIHMYIQPYTHRTHL